MDSNWKWLERAQAARVLVVGDVMLDHFIWGAVRRISPEAPVPVVEVEKEEWFPGGAANVARNLSPFTKHVLMLGRVGRDGSGKIVESLLRESGVNTELFVRSAEMATITKTRVIARQQQVVRVDRERANAMSDADVETTLSLVEKTLPDIDAVILEDYGKGMMTPALVAGLIRLCQNQGVLVTADPSPAHSLDWSGVSLVKPNRLEAFAAAGVRDSHLPGSAQENPELLRVGALLLQKWNTPAVLVTLGEGGMILFQRNQEPHHIPTRAKEIYDVSGAGDTAVALLTLARAAGLSWEEAADVANHASGVVVGKLGTASLTPAELLDAMEEKTKIE